MALIRNVWGRFVALWAGKSATYRVVIVVGVLILSPLLLIGALVGLTYELVAAVDRNHRLTTNAHWATSVFAVFGVLIVLFAVSPRSPNKATTDAAAVVQTVTPETGASSPTLAPAATVVEATSEPATARPSTPEPATRKPATPTPTRAPTATPDLTRDPAVVAAVLESQFGITFKDSPLSDGTVRKLGRDSSPLVMVELTDDPIKSMSVSGPIPGSGQGTENTIGSVLGAEAAAFGDPAGMTDWLLAQIAAADPSTDREVSKRFGKVVAHLQWYAATLGMMTITLDHD
jgi:hypothetical protein